jgi:CheY-like chemotaxis protein
MIEDIDDVLTQNNKLLLLSISGFALICVVIYVIYSHYAKQQLKTELLDKLTVTTNSSMSLMNKSFAKKIDQPNEYSILIVDDNEINQIVAAGLLESLPVEIKTASNGQEALDILNNTSTTFDLILMDCQMPIMDGFAATEAIRQGKAGYENSKISIIAMFYSN